MTWCLGTNTLFGYGVVLSDICATYSTGTQSKYFDCVQKSYNIYNKFVFGFAGYIEHGFTLMDDFKLCVSLHTIIDNKVEFVTQWYNNILKKYPHIVDTHILISACSSTNDHPVNKKSFGILIKFNRNNTYPTFEYVDNINSIYSIGSGSQVSDYVNSIKELFSKEFSSGQWVNLAQNEVNNPTGFAQALEIWFTNTVTNTPIDGISKYLHYHIILPDKIITRNNDYIIHNSDNTQVSIKMPLCDCNWKQLCNRFNKNNNILKSLIA